MYPELQPLLTLQIPDDWERIPIHDGYTVYGVRFYYRGNQRDHVDVSYFDNPTVYMTMVYGFEDKQYTTLQEVIERARVLMDVVARGVHFADIATVVKGRYEEQLLDRHGIGRGTISRLVDAFGTLEKLQEASIEEIEAVPGIGSDKAWLISDHLHSSVLYHELWDPTRGEWISLYQVPKEVIDECVRTHTYLTQTIRNRYRLRDREIKERGLVKERPDKGGIVNG